MKYKYIPEYSVIIDGKMYLAGEMFESNKKIKHKYIKLVKGDSNDKSGSNQNSNSGQQQQDNE